MVLRDYKPVPGTQIPRPGSSAGDQARDDFLAAMGVIMGDNRLLWTPNGTATTTATEYSRYAGVITWDATAIARYSPLGSGWAQDFNGTSHEGDISPDADRYSFGDSAVDSPFSIVWLGTPDVTTTQTLVAKANSSSAEEYELVIASDASGSLSLTDESTSGAIKVSIDPMVAASTTTLLVATYDGSMTQAGLTLYKDGTRPTQTRSLSGTYVAMENTAALVHIGARYTTKERFYNGKKSLVAICAKQLTHEDVWVIKGLVNGYFDLTL